MKTVRAGSGFIYKGRAIQPGDEFELPDPVADQKIAQGLVSEVKEEKPGPATPPRPVNRDPQAQHRVRQRVAGSE